MLHQGQTVLSHLSETVPFLVDNHNSQNLKSLIINNIIFPLLHYFCTKLTDATEPIKQLIEGAVQKAILENLNLAEDQNSSFMDVNQAADFLGIAKATLYGKCCNLLIPHFKKGKKLYFDGSSP